MEKWKDLPSAKRAESEEIEEKWPGYEPKSEEIKEKMKLDNLISKILLRLEKKGLITDDEWEEIWDEYDELKTNEEKVEFIKQIKNYEKQKTQIKNVKNEVNINIGGKVTGIDTVGAGGVVTQTITDGEIVSQTITKDGATTTHNFNGGNYNHISGNEQTITINNSEENNVFSGNGAEITINNTNKDKKSFFDKAKEAAGNIFPKKNDSIVVTGKNTTIDGDIIGVGHTTSNIEKTETTDGRGETIITYTQKKETGADIDLNGNVNVKKGEELNINDINSNVDKDITIKEDGRTINIQKGGKIIKEIKNTGTININ